MFHKKIETQNIEVVLSQFILVRVLPFLNYAIRIRHEKFRSVTFTLDKQYHNNLIKDISYQIKSEVIELYFELTHNELYLIVIINPYTFLKYDVTKQFDDLGILL